MYVVDNFYSSYHPDIIDFDTLKREYKDDMAVILTIQDKKINEEMQNSLCAFVPKENIINLRSNDERSLTYSMKRVLSMESLEREDYNSQRDIHTGGVKVRIMHGTCHTWNAIRTICEAFHQDNMFDLKIIIGYDALNGNKDLRCIQQVKREGYSFFLWDEYDAEKDRPDILIVSHPYDSTTNLGKLNKYVSLVVVACILLIRNEDTWDKFFDLQEKGFARFHPDFYIYDSLLYQGIKHAGYLSNNIVELGNAKFDGIYCACQEKKYKPGWEKLRGKKVVLWATDHGPKCTFDLYANKIFEYAEEHSDIGIIFRPHGSLISELLMDGIWTEDDVTEIKRYCAVSTNLIFDDSETYESAYSIADGILIDAICGMMVSALPTLKPICLVYRSNKDTVMHPELAKYYYAAYSKDEIVHFLELVRSNRDSMIDKRKHAFKKYIKAFDGKNGWRIKEYIKEKFCEKNGNTNLPMKREPAFSSE